MEKKRYPRAQTIRFEPPVHTYLDAEISFSVSRGHTSNLSFSCSLQGSRTNLVHTRGAFRLPEMQFFNRWVTICKGRPPQAAIARGACQRLLGPTSPWRTAVCR